MKHLYGLWLLPISAIVSPVYAVDYVSAAQAQKIIFPEAVNFEARPANLKSAQKDKIKDLAGVRQRWDTQQIWRAEKDGKTIGWFIVDDVIGKHEFITYGVGISSDGHVLGVEIMSYRESYGVGIREATWRKNFIGKTLADPFKLDEDVPNNSGGTLSSRNVLDGVKRLLVMQKVLNLGD